MWSIGTNGTYWSSWARCTSVTGSSHFALRANGSNGTSWASWASVARCTRFAFRANGASWARVSRSSSWAYDIFTGFARETRGTYVSSEHLIIWESVGIKPKLNLGGLCGLALLEIQNLPV